MGRAKAEMMRLDSLWSQAVGVAVKAGAVKECQAHEAIYVSQSDPEAESRAYAIGTNMVKSGQIDGTREEFIEAIQNALADAGDECTICAKNMAD